MAGFTLLTLLDDIASILDDVALMTKTAAAKTAGIVGDDLAVSAEQLSGVRSAREIPVVCAVAKGSLVNKLILIPAALIISSALPELLGPLLMVGGAWLCLEGAEKVHEKIIRTLKKRKPPAPEGGGPPPPPAPLTEEELAQKERLKIRGAVRTDFVLSAEIVTIALGSLSPGLPFVTKTGALIGVGIVMTFGVYGFVAGIVKLDDLGFLLLKKPDRSRLRDACGRLLVKAAPHIMRLLGIVGTVAMFLVGGGLLLHHLFPHFIEYLTGRLSVPGFVLNILSGALAGYIILGLLAAASSIRGLFRKQSSE
jgi:predicted DNA repair protein MutK